VPRIRTITRSSRTRLRPVARPVSLRASSCRKPTRGRSHGCIGTRSGPHGIRLSRRSRSISWKTRFTARRPPGIPKMRRHTMRRRRRFRSRARSTRRRSSPRVSLAWLSAVASGLAEPRTSTMRSGRYFLERSSRLRRMPGRSSKYDGRRTTASRRRRIRIHPRTPVGRLFSSSVCTSRLRPRRLEIAQPCKPKRLSTLITVERANSTSFAIANRAGVACVVAARSCAQSTAKPKPDTSQWPSAGP